MLVVQSCLTFAAPLGVACQASLSMEFSRQEYWSGQPFSSPGDLPNPGIEPRSLAMQADSLLALLILYFFLLFYENYYTHSHFSFFISYSSWKMFLCILFLYLFLSSLFSVFYFISLYFIGMPLNILPGTCIHQISIYFVEPIPNPYSSLFCFGGVFVFSFFCIFQN